MSEGATGVPEVGSVLAGRFRVEGLIGQGGAASVHRAVNLITGKRLAIKTIHLQRDGAFERLLREARAVGMVRHPNVIDVYDAVRDGDTVYLVMELLEGETLGHYLARTPTPPIPEFIELFLGALRGLAAAHRMGVIHRDLKPHNIFLARYAYDEAVIPKVLDFGLAAPTSRGLTEENEFVGTPLYMAPEQASGAKVDLRADIYAAGVILYEALTGQPPHTGSLPEVLLKALRGQHAPVRALSPSVPLTLADTVERAMSSDPERRHRNVEELIAELEPHVREPQRIPDSSVAPSERMSLPAASPPPASFWLIAVLATLALVAGVWGVRKHEYSDPSPPPRDVIVVARPEPRRAEIDIQEPVRVPPPVALRVEDAPRAAPPPKRGHHPTAAAPMPAIRDLGF